MREGDSALGVTHAATLQWQTTGMETQIGATPRDAEDAMKASEKAVHGTDRTSFRMDLEPSESSRDNGTPAPTPPRGRYANQSLIAYQTNAMEIADATVPGESRARPSERKVVRWVLAYIASGAMLLQVMEAVAEIWSVPLGIQRGVSLGLLLGVPHSLVIAWYHGEKGRQKMCGREVVCIAILTLAAALVLHLTLQ